MGLYTLLHLTGPLGLIGGLFPNMLSHHSFSKFQLYTKGPDPWFPNFSAQTPNFWSMFIRTNCVKYKITNRRMEVKEMRL